jgi:ASC-1-like (ASCH) protein
MTEHTYKFSNSIINLFEPIKNGIKMVEGRKYNPKIKVNDILNLFDNKIGMLKCLVTYVHPYKNTEDYLETETVEKAVPGMSSEEALKLYYMFNDKEQLNQLYKKYGFSFMGIGIKFLKEYKIHDMKLEEPYYSLMCDGIKKIEGRLNDEKRQLFNKGDFIKIFNPVDQKEITIFRIIDVFFYNSFRQMLEFEGLRNTLPNAKSLDEGVNMYSKWYSKENENKYKVKALSMIKIENNNIEEVKQGDVEQKGSGKNIIIHIAGASGAGKTTLGLKLKNIYKNKIILKDLDNLRDEFTKFHLNKNTSVTIFEKNFKKNYQDFLNDYIKNHSNKILVITGINTYINDEHFKYKNHLFKIKYILDTHADYKFCIDISPSNILKQRWYREYNMYIKYTCEHLKKSIDAAYNIYMTASNKIVGVSKIVPDLFWMMDRKLHIKHIKNWNKFYKDEEYEFLSYNNIIKAINKLI